LAVLLPILDTVNLFKVLTSEGVEIDGGDGMGFGIEYESDCCGGG
jgi:hypothetical protein